MQTTLFHVFRNTPLGREIFMQSLYFCKKNRASIKVYIPEFTKFLMYFDNDVVQVDLDSSYLTQPGTARAHAMAIAAKIGVEPFFLAPMNFTASTLPDISVDFDFMCCPRSISDFSTKISLGHIGPRVRRIVNSARFPVLIPSSQFKEWKSIMVFFGGSTNDVKALKLGLYLSRVTGMPLDLFTQAGKLPRTHFIEILNQGGLDGIVENSISEWHFFEEGKFEHNLFDVPHNALAVLGAYGHGLVKEMLFGSTMEMVQTTLTNTLLIAGPNYTMTYG